ncbi:hypothetical protein CALCODRAFT_266154 [Calocera cornea HHB12733]|uniref:Uncharacterized protein n=1 Tax=Calocera cornea HHB12733 TaxID=1353952 RepID=A0A165GAH7_9BASI|nr:hypothetical protein CALCODRAFT_266154 [Calocera cornea HHB12733]
MWASRVRPCSFRTREDVGRGYGGEERRRRGQCCSGQRPGGHSGVCLCMPGGHRPSTSHAGPQWGTNRAPSAGIQSPDPFARPPPPLSTPPPPLSLSLHPSTLLLSLPPPLIPPSAQSTITTGTHPLPAHTHSTTPTPTPAPTPQQRTSEIPAATTTNTVNNNKSAASKRPVQPPIARFIPPPSALPRTPSDPQAPGHRSSPREALPLSAPNGQQDDAEPNVLSIKRKERAAAVQHPLVSVFRAHRATRPRPHPTPAS